MTQIGIMMFATDEAIQPVALARAVEERGFESLFFPEHTHIPSSRETPFPGGGELPREYSRLHDPFVALTAAAAATSRIKLATGVCLIAQRDPIATAKAVASLDQISGGRFIFGIGAGWNAEELANHGVAFQDRWLVVREHVQAMRALWTQDAAEYHGRFVDFSPVWSWPKPVQPGGPPILLGSNATKWAYARIAEYCDGWMPLPGRSDLTRALPELAQTAANFGRSMDSISLTAFNPWPKADPAAREQHARDLVGLGFQRLVLGVPPAPAATVLPLLDEYAELAAKLAAEDTR